MTKSDVARKLFRWFLAFGAVVAAFFVALFLSVVLIFFSPFPDDLNYPLAGFATGLLLVLAGGLAAPRNKLAVALALFLVGNASLAILLNLGFRGADWILLSVVIPSTFAGSGAAVIYVGCKIHPLRTQRTNLIFGGGLFVASFVFIGSVIAYHTNDRQSMLETTLSWGRLAPIPANATDFRIAKGGNMFTRSFNASFTAPVADVKRWLRESPGTRDAKPERVSPTIRRIQISPGEGANFAEVTVDDKSGMVMIYVYWS